MGNTTADEGMTIARECSRAAAHILDSVTKTAQISSWATPQMQDMFEEWIGIIGRQILRDLDLPGRIDITATAAGIGISGSTLLGMLLFMQRRGSILITDIGVEKGTGRAEDTCDCRCGKE